MSIISILIGNNLMEPTLIHIDSFIVTGIKTQTTNANEMIPAQAKLSLLWGDFFSQHVAENVPHQVKNSRNYGVYTHYESDHNGRYDVIAGLKTTQPTKDKFVSVTIQGGNYLVFENKGQMPNVVVETWLRIWNYFDEPQSVTRLYTTDFEVYDKDSVAIYIAVKPSYLEHH
jgi:predicted transcriptional regulator YdeE